MAVWTPGTSAATWQTWTSSITTSTSATFNPWPTWASVTNAISETGTSAWFTFTRTANTAVWNEWQTLPNRIVVRNVAPRPTPEQVAARAAEKAFMEEKRAKEAEARKRARKLLCENLTPRQREQYERHGHFDVVVDGKTYRIHQGTHGNVRLLNAKGESVTQFCVQPDGVPAEDAMLAQKLALEHAPAEFFGKANARQMRPN